MGELQEAQGRLLPLLLPQLLLALPAAGSPCCCWLSPLLRLLSLICWTAGYPEYEDWTCLEEVHPYSAGSSMPLSPLTFCLSYLVFEGIGEEEDGK